MIALLRTLPLLLIPLYPSPFTLPPPTLPPVLIFLLVFLLILFLFPLPFISSILPLGSSSYPSSTLFFFLFLPLLFLFLFLLLFLFFGYIKSLPMYIIQNENGLLLGLIA